MSKPKQKPADPAPPPAAEHPAEDVKILKRSPVNPREIDPERQRKLGYSLKEFGDLGGIVWNEKSGELIAGHKRMDELEAAGARTWRRLSPGWGEIVHPATGERFPIRIVDWEEPKALAAMLVANNPHLQGEFTAAAVDLIHQVQEHESLAALELDRLLDDVTPAEIVDDSDDAPGLEDFDIRPRPRPAWILIAAPTDLAAELETELRARFAGDPDFRLECKNDYESERSRPRSRR